MELRQLNFVNQKQKKAKRAKRYTLETGSVISFDTVAFYH